MIDVSNPYTPTTDSPVEAEVVAALQGKVHALPLASIMCPGCSAVYAAAEEVRPFLTILCDVCRGQGERAVIATRHVRAAVEAVAAETKGRHGPLTVERAVALRDLLWQIGFNLAPEHPVQRHIVRSQIELSKVIRHLGRPNREVANA